MPFKSFVTIFRAWHMRAWRVWSPSTDSTPPSSPPSSTCSSGPRTTYLWVGTLLSTSPYDDCDDADDEDHDDDDDDDAGVFAVVSLMTGGVRYRLMPSSEELVNGTRILICPPLPPPFSVRESRGISRQPRPGTPRGTHAHPAHLHAHPSRGHCSGPLPSYSSPSMYQLA